MLGMSGRSDVLGRKHAAALVAEAVIPRKDDGVCIHFLCESDKSGHLPKVRALHDERESKGDRLLGIEEKITADRLHASAEAVSQERPGPIELPHHAQILANDFPAARTPDVLVGLLRPGIDGDPKLDDLLGLVT